MNNLRNPETIDTLGPDKRENSALSQGQAGCASLDTACNAKIPDYKPSLQARINKQLLNARHEAAKAHVLDELNYLLSKHPEIARILDLLEEVKY